jgi:hypothetical protein
MGIKFSQPTPHQAKMIKAFSEKVEEIYKISS